MKFKFDREIHLLLTIVLMTVMIAAELLFPPRPETGLRSLGMEGVIGAIVFTFMAIMSFMTRRNKWVSTVFLTIGVLVYTGLTNLTMTIDDSEDFDLLDMLQSAVSAMMIFTVFISSICTIGYFLRYEHNITRLIMLNAVMCVLLLMPWVFIRYIVHDILMAEEIFWDLLPAVLIRVFFMGYLARPDIKDVSPGKEIKLRLNRVESTLIMSNKTFMERADMDRMLGNTEEGWTELETGPIEKYCTVTMVAPSRRKFTLTVRKWKGEDFTRVVLSPERNSTGSWGLHFDIVEYTEYEIEGKNIVRIYGHDGVFVDIYTDNPLIYEDNKISHALDKLVREY